MTQPTYEQLLDRWKRDNARPCHDREHHGSPRLRDPIAIAERARRFWPAAFTWLGAMLEGKPTGLGPELSEREQRVADEIAR